MHHISLFGTESNLRNPDAALNYDLHVLGSHKSCYNAFQQLSKLR